jgi:hypothetical protein
MRDSFRFEVIDMHPTMPRPQSENTYQVSFKIPEAWLELADQVAAKLSPPGVTMSRTDAFRAALIDGLRRLAEVPEAPSAKPETAKKSRK